MLEAGSPAPAIILWQDKDGKYHVLDGVQRLNAAALFGDTRCAAYVVAKNTKISTQNAIRVFSNGRINGQYTPDKQFILRTAVELMYFVHKYSVGEIARLCGRKACDVEGEIAFQRTVENLQCTGYEGKYLNRRNGWFAKGVGKVAEDDDFYRAPAEIKAWTETMEQCKFKNGDATPHIHAFFNVKRSAKRDRAAQFRERLADMKRDPEIRQRLGIKDRKSYVTDILPSLRRSCTTVWNAVDDNDQILDHEYAELVAESFRRILEGLRKITPRDIQYPTGKHSSIFDKG